MGLETAALAAVVGMGAFTAATQVMAGRAQAKSLKRQGEFNAQVYEQQASMVESQKKVEEYQYNRRLAQLKGAIVSRAAGGGLLLSGSPAALLVDAETQMQYDKAIGQYNLEVQRRYALSGAEYYRYTGREQARLAKFQGYTNAFSTILRTGSSMMMGANMGAQTSSIPKAATSSYYTYGTRGI